MFEFRDEALKPHDCLVVAFTGLGHALGQIPFEFHRTLSGTDCAPLYVRDLARRWYQYGPDGGSAARKRRVSPADCQGHQGQVTRSGWDFVN
jgi:hypothetical protein